MFNEVGSIFVAPSSTSLAEMMKDYPTNDRTFSPTSFTLIELKKLFKFNFI